MPSKKSLFHWDCVLFIHQGLYAGAVLRFKMVFKEDYPRHPPAVTFLSDTIFHPLISQDGKLSLKARFQTWIPQEHHVFDVLHAIKAAFKKDVLDRLEEKDCLNREAYKLYLESPSSFAALARQTALLSQRDSALYDRDHPTAGHTSRGTNPQSSGIQFLQLDDNTLDDLRSKIGLSKWTSTQS